MCIFDPTISPALWREIGGNKLDQFCFVPARGAAGGIIIGWNNGLFSGKLLKLGDFSLSVEFVSKRENLVWWCTAVYGPNARALKNAFWGELRDYAGDPSIP